MYRVSRDLYGKRRIAGQGRLYGLGACGFDPSSGEAWCSPDTSADAIRQFDLAADARDFPKTQPTFAQWLNKNASTVALGAGAFFLLFAMTKR